MFLGQTIKMCFKNIISNKLRSFLTMLGIIIGISSVIVLVGFTQGTSEDISSSLQNLGANVLTVNIYNSDSENLTYKDLKDEEFNFVEDVVMVNSTRTNAKANDTSSTYTFIGTTSNYLDVQKISISQGRNIADLDIENSSNVALIGSTVAQNLFSSDLNAVGEKILLNSSYYTVVGVLGSGSSSSTDTDSAVIVPITSYAKTSGDDNVSTIYFVGSEDITNTDMIEKMATSQLGRKISTDNIEVVTQDTIASTVSEVDTMTQILIALVGAISLIVSGIGVMNIMIVSVYERTREIGVRKAIGATDFDILKQFLIEAILLTTFGGILGVIVGLLFKIVSKSIGISFSVNLNIVSIALIFSILIGVIFGIIPAIRASKLRPIEALKYE